MTINMHGHSEVNFLLVPTVLLWYPIIWFLWNISMAKQASINLPSNGVGVPGSLQGQICSSMDYCIVYRTR